MYHFFTEITIGFFVQKNKCSSRVRTKKRIPREQLLLGYLEDYHIDRGYMLSFNFNRNKKIGVQDIFVGEKTITEAVV